MSIWQFKKVNQVLMTMARRFVRNDQGSLTPLLGLAAVPLFAAAGAAIDYNRVLDNQVELQSLADRAALTGASYDGASSRQKQAAETFMETNKLTIYGTTYSYTVVAANDQVDVQINANIQGTFLPVAFAMSHLGGSTLGGQGSTSGGSGNSVLPVTAKAKVVETDPAFVCLLTTDPTADNAMYFRGTGGIEAKGCGFHSDSNSEDQALHLQGNAVAKADFFHTVGGWMKTGSAGAFSVTPESDKKPMGNPFNLTINCPTAAGSNVNVNGSAASPTSLSASVYNNISVNNNNVGAFTSGTHYIKGTIDLKNGGLLKGMGVTLVLCGANARIEMNGGALQLQAPTTGSYPGFAVVGSASATMTSDLHGGANTFIRGIWYTPNSKLNIVGNAEFNVNSSYFPIIADQFEIGGTGKVNIAIDYNAYGYAAPTELLTPQERTVWLIN